MEVIALAAVGGFSQTTLLTASTTAIAVNSAAGSFFSQLFMHPGQAYATIIACGAVVVLGVVGLAFLIKMLYQRATAKPVWENPNQGMIPLDDFDDSTDSSSSSDNDSPKGSLRRSS